MVSRAASKSPLNAHAAMLVMSSEGTLAWDALLVYPEERTASYTSSQESANLILRHA